MSSFPETSVTMVAKLRDLGPEADAAEWVRFWDMYSPALRRFAAEKGGEANADDIVMNVLGKLVDVLREGRYNVEKGRLHSYLMTMTVNEIRMSHRKAVVRAEDRKVSLDAPIAAGDDAPTVADTIAAPEADTDRLDEEWRAAVLASAVDHVLTKTALSARDREVWRLCVDEGREIPEVAERLGLSRNNVSQIKTRISKRIVAVGQEMLRGIGYVA